jgi:acyl-coenzyme A synthetase/AMP-(fatty) acid ligase
MMNAGGFRVSPLEVEAAMASFPGLTDSAAIELEVKAGASIIALAYAAATPLPDHALAAHAAASLARYKQPRAFFHHTVLPRNANGKLNRRALRQTISQNLDAP